MESAQAAAEELLVVMVKSYQESENSRILEAGRAWDILCQPELRAMQTMLLGPQYSSVLLLGQTLLAPRLGQPL